eukprot:3616891-Pleurochrysis_carterae.AAC.3
MITVPWERSYAQNERSAAALASLVRAGSSRMSRVASGRGAVLEAANLFTFAVARRSCVGLCSLRLSPHDALYFWTSSTSASRSRPRRQAPRCVSLISMLA